MKCVDCGGTFGPTYVPYPGGRCEACYVLAEMPESIRAAEVRQGLAIREVQWQILKALGIPVLVRWLARALRRVTK